MSPKQKRIEIKRLLSLLEERNRLVFKLMYSHTDLDKDVNEVVDELPAKRLNWALSQCQSSYHKLFDLLRK